MEKQPQKHNIEGMNKNIFILGILFMLYLGIYMILKAINEISNNSIEYIGNLNELLGVVVATGVSYYVYLRFIVRDETAKDIFKPHNDEKTLHPFMQLLLNLTITALSTVSICYIVYYKTMYWQGGGYIVLFSGVLSFITVFSSLTMES